MARPKIDPALKRRVISPKIRPDLIEWLQSQKELTGESQAGLIEQALDDLIAKRKRQTQRG